MIIEKIRHIPLLSEMDTAVLDRCIAENQLVVRHYSKGATVHHQHEACSVLDVVLSGKLVAYSLSENGSKQYYRSQFAVWRKHQLSVEYLWRNRWGRASYIERSGYGISA